MGRNNRMNKKQRRQHKKAHKPPKLLPVETMLFRRGLISPEEYEHWHTRFAQWGKSNRVHYQKDGEYSDGELIATYKLSQKRFTVFELSQHVTIPPKTALALCNDHETTLS